MSNNLTINSTTTIPANSSMNLPPDSNEPRNTSVAVTASKDTPSITQQQGKLKIRTVETNTEKGSKLTKIKTILNKISAFFKSIKKFFSKNEAIQNVADRTINTIHNITTDNVINPANLTRLNEPLTETSRILENTIQPSTTNILTPENEAQKKQIEELQIQIDKLQKELAEAQKQNEQAVSNAVESGELNIVEQIDKSSEESFIDESIISILNKQIPSQNTTTLHAPTINDVPPPPHLSINNNGNVPPPPPPPNLNSATTSNQRPTNKPLNTATLTFESVVEKIKTFAENGQTIKIEGLIDKQITNKTQFTNSISEARKNIDQIKEKNESLLHKINGFNKQLVDMADFWKNNLINSSVPILTTDVKALKAKYSNHIDFLKDANKLYATGLLSENDFQTLKTIKESLEKEQNALIENLKKYQETQKNISKLTSQINSTKFDIPSIDYGDNLLKLIKLAKEKNVPLDEFLANVTKNIQPLSQEQNNIIKNKNSEIEKLNQQLDKHIESYCRENGITINGNQSEAAKKAIIRNLKDNAEFKQISDEIDRLQKEKQSILQQEITINKLILKKIDELQPKTQLERAKKQDQEINASFEAREALLNDIRKIKKSSRDANELQVTTS